jgi:hypothetical protein
MKLLLAVAGLLFATMMSDAKTANPSADDRVGFPADYQSKFQSIRASNKVGKTLLGTIYANEKAASIHDLAKLPYPNGSIIVMEWAQPLKDENGTLLLDSDGLWRKGDVVRIDVMRREAGYGESYGEKRSGDWEFASYGPDGSVMQPATAGASCAECHRTATVDRDFVFRGRFPPLAGE